MANNPLTLGAVVSNTNPALSPGPEPLTGQHVTLERLTQNHSPDLYENVGSHDNLWAWLPDGPFSTTSDFVHWLNPHLEKSAEPVVYTVLCFPDRAKAKQSALPVWSERTSLIESSSLEPCSVLSHRGPGRGRKCSFSSAVFFSRS